MDILSLSKHPWKKKTRFKAPAPSYFFSNHIPDCYTQLAQLWFKIWPCNMALASLLSVLSKELWSSLTAVRVQWLRKILNSARRKWEQCDLRLYLILTLNLFIFQRLSGAAGIEGMKQSRRKADDSSVLEMPVKGHRVTKVGHLVSTFEKHFFKE